MKTSQSAGEWSAVALLLLSLIITGCGQARKEPAETPKAKAEEPKVAQTEVAQGDADLLQNLPLGASATNTVLAEGDRAWKELLQLLQPPSYPAEWETNPPSKEAIADFEKRNGRMALAAADKAREFYTKYAKHEMAGEARDREMYLLSVAVQLGQTNAASRLSTLEEEKLKDPKLSDEERLQLRVGQLQRSAAETAETDPTATLTRLEKGARALMKDFPEHAELAGLLISVAQGWLDHGQMEKTRALARELADGNRPEEIRGAAQGLLKKLDRVGKPLAIAFRAIDGRDVSLAALKGKVVLVDFWATWCGPCMLELPKVKGAYEKLHAKGFEIVGISFDREKTALEKIVAREKMVWPQHFDESSDRNKFGEEFEIASIPTMWLVDKKGNLRDLNGRENLAEKVERLLAE